MKMKIEAVTVCVGYADFLEHALHTNLNFIDRLVVVTTPEDHDTGKLCDKYGVDCVRTHAFFEDGDTFNKGRAINLGLQHLRHDGWLLHLDADVILPHNFRKMLQMAKLDPSNIYGADRLCSDSYEHWMKNRDSTVPQHQWRFLVNPPASFRLGSRLLHNEYGWCPIGYFQLWSSSVRRQYPVVCGSAEHSDVVFAVQWARENRILLPELFVFHLASEDSPMGANWSGRRTKPFRAGGDNSKFLSHPLRY